ncbi:MAG: exodeoxyribonuclease VII large subunit [Chloroflexota bacterium]
MRVSDVSRYLKQMIEADDLLGALSVRGEIGELSRAASGHIYFTLKDSTSQLSCVLFRREAAYQQEDVRQMRRGAEVIVHGFLTLYEPRGTYQLYVERVLTQGEGALFQRVERVRAQLEKEGLFAPERKRPLPSFARKLALITSPGSQAYHDVLHRLRTQYPFVTVIVAGASVQGDGAAGAMAMAIDVVNRLTDAEVILLVRGGGAPEDLAAFNDERLARAIFASRLPIITGIGHETDHSIADFVADVRAATPSLAAAAAVPDVASLVQRTARLHDQVMRCMRHQLQGRRRRWLELNRLLLRSSPKARLRTQRQRADELERGASHAAHALLDAKRARLDGLLGRLAALDPLAVLERGYAVLMDRETGRVLNRRAQASVGQALTARVADGEFVVRVENA